ncbi:Insecticyanin-A [Gryllus bimaculatus]|nr:Insecticyanin-A [Gryllus bimaculatus]
MTWLRSTLVLVVLGMAAAQMPGLGPCPQFVAKNNFNMKEFMGMWYEVERMFQVLEVASRCIAANYTESPDGKIHVHNFVTSRLTNIQRVLDGEVQLTGKDGEGKVVVKYNVIPVTTYDTEYTVLDTDYKNFAVLYHCSSPLPFFNTRKKISISRAPVC